MRARFGETRRRLLDATLKGRALVLDPRRRLVQLGERAAQSPGALDHLGRFPLVPLVPRLKLRGLRFHASKLGGGGAAALGGGGGLRALPAEVFILRLGGASRGG